MDKLAGRLPLWNGPETSSKQTKRFLRNCDAETEDGC